MLNVKETLRREGVVGVLKAVGCQADGAHALAEECGADFGLFWRQVPNGGYMLQLAIDMGVDGDLVLQTARELVARLVAETGDCEAEVSECMGMCEAAFLEPKKASENLQVAVDACAGYIKRSDALEMAKSGEPWRGAIVATSLMLAQATMMHVCPCGALHTKDVMNSLFNMALSAGVARVAHGLTVGRIPEGQGQGAVMDWAMGIMADQVRELLPVELLLAQKMQTFPGVTKGGELVFNTRPVRGQA